MPKKYHFSMWGLCFCMFMHANRTNAQVKYVINTVAGTGTAGYYGDGKAATGAELNAASGVSCDANGNLYIGDGSNNRVRILNTSGIINTYAGNGWPGYSGDGGPATSAMFSNPVGVFYDNYNNSVMIGDEYNNRVRMVNSANNVYTIAGNGHFSFSGDGGPATNAQFFFPNGIAKDPSGNIYITDCWNHRIRKINTSGIISTFAGNGTSGYSGDGGAATAAELSFPSGVAVDASGNLYIADAGNNRIRKVTTSGTISTFAGNGTGGYAGDGSAATAAELNGPSGVAISSGGNVYIADKSNNRVRLVTGGTISTYAGDGTAGYSGDGGSAISAELNNPTGVAIDNSSNLYISDANNNRVREVVPAGAISTYAGNGISGISGDGGAATAAELNSPSGVSVDNSGNVYIADAGNNRLRKITSGTISTFAGNGTASFAGDGGAATSAELHNPYAVTVDPGGNVFTADEYNQRIREINTSGTITTIAGNGLVSFSGDGKPADSAQLFFPIGTIRDIHGNIYIADCFNQRIRKIDISSGLISTFAGNGTNGYAGDGGAATAAELSYPIGLASDYHGNIYVADEGNNRIRKIDTTGTITTLAGNGTAGYTGDGNPATAAELNGPTGVFVDPFGSVYIADKNNSVIRRIDKTGKIVTLAGNGISGFSGDGGLATSAELNNPWAITMDNHGNIFVSDYKNNRIRELTPNCTFPLSDSTVSPTCVGSSTGRANVVPDSGSPPYTYSWSSGQTTANVTGLSAGSYTVSVTDSKGCNAVIVVNVTPPPYLINTIAGDGVTSTTGNGGPSVLAGLFPIAVEVNNTTGDIYIGDVNNNCVRKVDKAGIISTFAGTGALGYSGDGGPANLAKFNGVTGLAIDKAGNVYIADEHNEVVRKVNTSGIISTFAGNGTAGHTGDGGAATSAELDNPCTVAVDSKGNVYISDYTNNAVRVVNTSGTISTYAGGVGWGYAGDGGPATNAKFRGIQGLAFDSKDNLYLTDDSNFVVRMVNTSGIISLVAGTPVVKGFSGDGGPATAAEMTTPWGIAIDPDDNVVFGDVSNARIRMIDRSGNIHTIAGTGTNGHSGDGGPATSANINGYGFEGVGADDQHNIYLADGFWGYIRKLHSCPCSLSTSPTVTKESCFGDSNGVAMDGASSAFPGFNYFWLGHKGDTNNTASNLKSGLDSVFVKDADFCWTIDGISMPSDAKITVTTTGTGSICEGGTAGIAASCTVAKSFAWSTGATTAGISVTPASTQTYTVTATDGNGCTGDTTFQVNVTAFSPAISGPDSICPGDLITLAASGGKNYTWNNGTTSSTITVSPHSDTTYVVTITNGSCIDSIIHPVIVSTDGSLCAIKIYTGITPNGDGHNDYWVIDNIGLFPNNTVDIFNRWGSKVWYGTGYDNNKVVWKGQNMEGQPLPDGTYFYIVNVNGKQYTGWVQLTR